MPDVLDIPVPPRRVRRIRGYALMAIHTVLLIVLLMFWQLFWVGGTGTIRVLWFSQTTPAVVQQVTTVPGERGPVAEVVLAYRVDDADYSRHFRISPDEAESMHPGDVHTVYFVPERPDVAELRFDRYPVVLVTIFCGVLALAPGAAAAALLWKLLVTPWRIRRLLRDGEIATGVILERNQTEGKGACLALTYEYEVPAPDLGQIPRGIVSVRAKMTILGQDFVGKAVGDSVTVIYDLAHPRHSVIYEYTDYRFVAPATCPT
jgi:hypothetical protein